MIKVESIDIDEQINNANEEQDYVDHIEHIEQSLSPIKGSA